jgi:hypothetical protein
MSKDDNNNFRLISMFRFVFETAATLLSSEKSFSQLLNIIIGKHVVRKNNFFDEFSLNLDTIYRQLLSNYRHLSILLHPNIIFCVKIGEKRRRK